jgi:DNA-binding IclR family transcriptional regulator
MVRALRNHDDLEDLRRKMPFHAGTLAKGMMILQAFLRDARPHANSELSELLGLPRPTVSRLCQTLLELGYLDLDERSDRYFIGPAAVAIGYPYIVSAPLRLQARPAMQALADQIRGAVSMGVAMDLDVVYLETSAWQRGTLARPDVGAVRAVAETAMGRACRRGNRQPCCAACARSGLTRWRAARRASKPRWPAMRCAGLPSTKATPGSASRAWASPRGCGTAAGGCCSTARSPALRFMPAT